MDGFLVQVIGSLIAIVCALASRCEKKKNVKRHSLKRNLGGQLSKARSSRVLLPADVSDRHYASVTNADISSQMLTIQNQLGVILSKHEQPQERKKTKKKIKTSNMNIDPQLAPNKKRYTDT
jgi:hypothetical protein